MQNNSNSTLGQFSREPSSRQSTGRPGTGLQHGRGFGTALLLAGLSLTAVLAGLAVPSYLEALEKRLVSNDAERIAAFVDLARSESLKRFSRLTVSYAMRENGEWCIGSQLGKAPCDCMETSAFALDYCAIGGNPMILRDSDLESGRTVRSLEGDGAYTFDPVRGILVDPEDILVLALSEDVGRYEVELRVNHTGMPQLCVPTNSKPIEGLDRCP